MSERGMEDWLVRYLVVLVVGSTALLALLYGLVFMNSMGTAALSVVVLALVSVLVVRDLRDWRTA
ncbi:hypothetical protein [Halorarum salinum]|uniref:Uncharacterized protein n=1 Tax=Halorarum salinum TaxID=2743089 RepID=A0A7D5QE02_9EURY|nr:hypothetical protein [Halobaculum salinum]QLG62541.1 hypothetical protein HUG12_12720 [Halobaculum salinum]